MATRDDDEGEEENNVAFVGSFVDNSKEDIQKQLTEIKAMLFEVTRGNVEVECHIPGKGHTRFVLGTNSLDYKKAIMDHVDRYMRPPYVATVSKEGEAPQPRSIAQHSWAGGDTTVVLVRSWLYKSNTKTWSAISRIGIKLVVVLLAMVLFWWLFSLL